MSITFIVVVRRFFVFVTIISLLIGSNVFAQELPKDIQAILEKDPNTLTEAEIEKVLPYVGPGAFSAPSPERPTDAVNCFDYYTFGSVQVDASPTLEQTLPGLPLTFTGKIKNDNPYPIVDGQVYVKIFKHDQVSDALTKENGYPLVAFFLAKDKISIAGKSEQDITFDWQVPASLSGGEYEAAFYFTSAHRYNLLGLSFTDDVTGNKATFKITGLESSKEPVTWNKNAVMLNDDTKFRFASFPPRFPMNEPVTAHVELTNPSNEERVVEVTWITSKWDGILPEHEVKKETQGYALKPKETLKLAYTPDIFESSVTFLQAIAKDNDAESIMHIRFVRDGFEETRINFPSLMSYPLKANTETTIFSCLHSTNLPIISDNTLTLTLKDKNNNIVHTYTYEGDVTGDMMGVKDTFTPKKDLANFSLTATLKHNDQIVDEVTQVYDCNAIDPATCVSESILSSFTPSGSNTRDTLIYIFMSLIALATLYFVLERRKKDDDDTMKNKMKMPTIPLVLLFTILTAFGAGVGSVEAASKSVKSSVNELPELVYYGLSDGQVSGVSRYGLLSDNVPLSTAVPCTRNSFGQQDCSGVWTLGLNRNAFADITYRAKLINVTPGDPNFGTEIIDATSVSIGTKIRVDRIEDPVTDIFWNGTGQSWDSPNGRWVNDAGPLSLTCHEEDIIVRIRQPGADVNTYILLNVKPVIATISSPNLSCSGNVCQVMAAGPVSVTMNFSDTYGKFYYRHGIANQFQGFNGCDASNIPMRKRVPGMVNSRFGMVMGNIISLYDVPFPARSITFNLTAIPSNANPRDPNISPNPLNGLTNTSYPFTFSGSTDIDGDRIAYQISWDGNTTPDQTTAIVNSGQSSSASNPAGLWPDPVNGKIFKVRAIDINGAGAPKGGSSNWVDGTVNLADSPNLTSGPILLNTGTLFQGNTATFLSSVTNGSDTATPNFEDKFEYRWGNAGAWTAVNTINHAPLGKATRSDTSDNVVFNNNGTLEVQHCVDTTNTVVEGVAGEADNCRAQSFMVSPAICTALPLNATYYGATNITGLLANTPAVFSAGDTAAKCEFSCNAGHSWNGTICARPNLTATTPTLRSGSLTQGSTVTFQGTVNNDSALTLTFSDQFSHSTDGITWTPLNTIPHNNLTGPATDISSSFILTQPGAFYVRLCADNGLQVPESNEADNCSTLTTTVKGATINAPDCTIPPGGTECTTDVTWTTSGLTGTPSIKKNGTQFDTAISSLGSPQSLTNGLTTFSVYDGTTLIASDQANASCASGSSWDTTTGKCTGNPPPAPGLTFTATPDTDIPYNGSTELKWTIDADTTGCWATNNKGNTQWIGWQDHAASNNKTITNLTENTTFTLICYALDNTPSNPESVPVTVLTAGATNLPPVVNAGGNRTITFDAVDSTKNKTTATGASASDPEGLPLNSTTWSKTAGGAGGTITGGTTLTPTFDALAVGSYTFRLTVTDAGGLSTSDSMNVDVLPAGTPPSANPISLRAAPRVVDEGENTTLTWNTGGEVEPNCTLKGGEFGTTGINLPTDNGDDYTGSLQTPVYANTTYTLHCPMSLPADAQAKVEIVPRYFPS